jgi:hypothetical protein
MIRFEVINSGVYWDVEGFDPDNPNDRVLANRSMTQGYAERLAADLNRLADIEPTAASTEPDAKREQSPKPNFLFDSNGQSLRRKIRFKD